MPSLKTVRTYTCSACCSVVTINEERSCQPCGCGTCYWLQDDRLITVKPGDTFVVREGEKDPDFQFDISSWRGTIKKLIENEPWLPSRDWALCEWENDSEKNTPEAVKNACYRNGWRTNGVRLSLKSLRIVTDREEAQVNFLRSPHPSCTRSEDTL